MLLLLRERRQPPGHRACLLEVADLDERLDEIRRDGVRARVVHAFPLRPHPDGAQAVGRTGRVVREESGHTPCAERFEHVPSVPRPLRKRDRLGRPALRLARVPATGGKERAAALVHRPEQQLALGELRPLVEQALGLVPAAGAQLELAQVEPLERVRRGLAALVRHHHEPRQRLPRRSDLAPPDEPLTRDPLGRLRDVEGVVRGAAEALAQIVDGVSAHAARPRQGVERDALDVRPCATRRAQRLERPALGLLHPLDANGRDVLGHLREHGRAGSRDGPGRGERRLEVGLDLVVVGDGAPCEEQVGPDAQRAVGKRLQLGADQVGDALPLARDLEIPAQLEHALDALRARRPA